MHPFDTPTWWRNRAIRVAARGKLRSLSKRIVGTVEWICCWRWTAKVDERWSMLYGDVNIQSVKVITLVTWRSAKKRLPGVRVKLYIIHHTDTLWNKESSCPAYVDFPTLQHPRHTTPRTVLASISPAIRYAKANSKQSSLKIRLARRSERERERERGRNDSRCVHSIRYVHYPRIIGLRNWIYMLIFVIS